ncbi:TetR family transcriptional regulator [Streptomyces minutiscleroticus]|uniref:TetR family transcriptional regulator n=1 Tax=Streptomyces minutiscleroticus TaxID=68238 RepID=A0A918NPG6_9ACTN|nr:TetR family transcriptional regulator [Streptomyces minutiscleroticus]GGX84607.1 TetR family transcriptional regulator [Streptomyces minutiscleroticus]
MSKLPPDVRRARRPEHKELRLASILDAARTLAADKGVRAVTLTDIAAAAGINKSAVLRYVETREDIYLRLTAEGWTQWAAAVGEALGDRTDGTADELADVLSRTVVDRPLFCDLLAHAPLNLERHVSADAVLTYKLAALEALEAMAEDCARFLPALGTAAARELVGTVSLLAGALWQIASPPEALARLYAEEPRLAHARVDLLPRLTGSARALIVGLAG